MDTTTPSTVSTRESNALITALSRHTAASQRKLFLLNKIQPTAELLHQITQDYLIGQVSHSIYRRSLNALVLKPDIGPLLIALQKNDLVGRESGGKPITEMAPLLFPHFEIDEIVRWRLETLLGIREEVKRYKDDTRFARAIAGGLEDELAWFLDNGE